MKYTKILKNVLILHSTFLILNSLFAQETGFPIIRNYTPKEYKNEPQVVSIIQDQRGVMYFGAGRSLMEYDGISWRKITVGKQNVVYGLGKNKNGKIYVAAQDEFGCLDIDSKGYTICKSIAQLLNDTTFKIGAVWSVKLTSDLVYFKTYNAIIQFNPENNKLSVFKADMSGKFFGDFIHKDIYYVRLSSKGLMKIENNVLKQASQSEFFKDNKPFRVAVPLNVSTWLLPTRTEGMYLYQPDYDLIPQPYTISKKDFVLNNNIFSASLFLKKYFILGSIQQGAILMDKHGIVKQQYKENNLLQSNTIYEIQSDTSQNIWFATSNGICKTEHGLDLTYWDKNNGLKGTVYSVIRYNGTVYIATETKVYFIDKNDKIQEVTNIPTGQNWCFLETKVNKSLLCSTSKGIYEIKGDKAILMRKGEHAFKLVQSVKNPLRVFSTDYTNLISIRFENGKWINEGKWKGIEEDIREIIEDETGDVWLGTLRNGAIRITPNSGDITNPGKIFYYSKKEGLTAAKQITPCKFKNQIIWLSEKGFFIHNPKTNRFEPFCQFGEKYCNGSREISKFIETPDSKIWLTQQVNNIKDIGYLQENNKLEYEWFNAPFRRIPEMSIIAFYIDTLGIVWIGGSEGLYRYDMSMDTKNYAQKFNCLIRKVSIDTDSAVYGGNTFFNYPNFTIQTDIKYEFNTMKFEFAAPFFDHEEKTLYSHQLVGYEKEWSLWSRQTEKEFTNLNEGKYILKVKAKNIYNVESEIDSYPFIIHPPWQRTWWAYSIYVILSILLILLILKYYTRRLVAQKEHLEQVVKERTAEIEQQKEEIQGQAVELQTTNSKLLELDHFKEGMTGMIVHDLKNPLNSIINSNDIKRIKQSGKQMLNMVMNILDVQKFEDAKMKLELRNNQVYSIAENAYNQVKMLINEKNITFENQINQQLGIKTDSEILERVFVNLLTNAIKYTPNNGKIFIMNELMDEKMNDVKPDFIPSFFHSFILFKVSDTGQGIPADKLHLVFEKFGQVEAKKSGGIRSTGLGLTFCKLAIEAHGGKIGVESEVDIGTTFWFTIPLGTEIENTNFVEVQQTKAETFGLSDEDKQILLPLLPQFKKLEVYEVSDIRNLLKNIDIRNNPNLQFWVEEMKNIVRAGNEENYAALINLIENGKI